MMGLFSMTLYQILLAVVASVFTHKLVSRRFFSTWLASYQFKCLMVPTNDEIRHHKKHHHPQQHEKQSGGKKGKGKHKRDPKRTPSPKHSSEDEVFKVPSVNVELFKFREKVLEAEELGVLNYHKDLEWIIDLSFAALLCYIIIELAFWSLPSNDFNLSIVYALLIVVLSVKMLIRLTAYYYISEETFYEKSICSISGCLYLFVALLVLMPEEEYLEFGLDKAYRSFNESAAAIIRDKLHIDERKIPTKRLPDLLLVKLFMSVFSAIVGVLFTFPGFRFGKLHKSMMERPDISKTTKTIATIQYMTPLFVVLLWVKPLYGPVIFDESAPQYGLDEVNLNIFRIFYILITNFGRFYLTPLYYGMFLASSKQRLSRFKWRGGTTTNKEIKGQVAIVYNFINVAVIQYTVPILICTFTTLLYFAMCDHSLIPSQVIELFYPTPLANVTTKEAVMATTSEPTFGMFTEAPEDSVITRVPEILDSVITHAPEIIVESIRNTTYIYYSDLRKIFSIKVLRGILAFATWWVHFAWFAATTVGYLYHSYFN